jgi:UDP-N-acetylglucosamine 2-epimerase (non-hydrolysing)
MKVVTILGTRPEIIRLSAVLKELDDCCEHSLIHTGQNYDSELSSMFFTELGLRAPDFNLAAAGETPVQTIAHILAKIEPLLKDIQPDAVLVLGDTNSALSVYAAKRLKIPIFHMEAGNRCFDERVPEEINRRLVDHMSDINLVYSERAREHLLREGFPPERIIKTGSPIYEVLQKNATKIDSSQILAALNLLSKEYFLASFHREENVTVEKNLRGIIDGLRSIATIYKKPIIVSTHPRTRAALEKIGIHEDSQLRFLKPLGFFDYVHLQKNALSVISDSGTISEEASALQVPAVMIRQSHERPEGMDEAVVVMSDVNMSAILGATQLALRGSYGPGGFRMVSDYAVPNVSKKVVRLIMSHISYVRRRVWKQYE